MGGGGWYQNLVSGQAPNSFPPLRGTNSTTTTNFITGIANFNSNKGSLLTLSSQGLFENIVKSARLQSVAELNEILRV